MYDFEHDDIVWLMGLIGEGEVLNLREIYNRALEDGWRASIPTLRRRMLLAVEAGIINRRWDRIFGWRGWVYAWPSDMPTLLELTEWSGSDDDVMEVLS